jgi:hypothetical protein
LEQQKNTGKNVSFESSNKQGNKTTPHNKNMNNTSKKTNSTRQTAPNAVTPTRPRDKAASNEAEDNKDDDDDTKTPPARPKTNPMFLNKIAKINPYAKKVNKMKDVTRKFQTYIKLKFGKILSSKLDDQALEVLNVFQQIMNRLWTHDNSLLLLPWREGSKSIPLKPSMEFPKTQESLNNYLDRLWLEPSRVPYS